MNCPRSQRTRSAFTLVELLIVIAVIGILAGMLAFGLMPALKRSREFTIQQEMTHIEGSIEQFKIKYGFYPPSFVRIKNTDFDGDGSVTDEDRANTLLQYINRIAPNHQESVGTFPNRPVDDWWAAVGTNIHFDDGDDLVFWLSGLTTSKQFPLTGNGTDTPNAYNDGGVYKREEFYEFDSGQLEIEGIVAHYLQPSGKEVPFLYIDNASYGFGPSLPSQPPGLAALPYDGYTNGAAYEKPDTFQLITFGMDGIPGIDTTGLDIETDVMVWTNWAREVDGTGNQILGGNDNICNFSQGRLDRLRLGTVQSTAN